MSYLPDLDQTQLGTESVWGTGVAGTGKLGLISSCEITPEVDTEVLKDIRGSLAPGFVAVLNSHKGSAALNGECSYEDQPYILDSLLGTATPGASTTYTRAYTAQLASVPTRTKYTIIKGSSGKVQSMTGGVFTEYGIKIQTNKTWEFTSKLIGKQVQDASLASLNDRTQTPIHANVTSVYLDAVGGTMGATALTTILFTIDMTFKNNSTLLPKIGSLYPATYVDAPAECNLKFSADVDSTTAGYLTSILGTSVLQKQIRILATTGSAQIIQFDFAGLFKNSPKLNTDKDGVSTFEFEMDAIYNAALGNYFKASVTNSISVMP